MPASRATASPAATPADLSLQEWNDGLTYFCVGTPGACGTAAAGNDGGWHLVTMVFDGTQPTDATRRALAPDEVMALFTGT